MFQSVSEVFGLEKSHLSLLKQDRDEKSLLMVGWPKKGECRCFFSCLRAGHSQETHGGSEIAKSSGHSKNKLSFSFNKKFLTFSQVLPFSMFWPPQVERFVDFKRVTRGFENTLQAQVWRCLVQKEVWSCWQMMIEKLENDGTWAAI